MYYRMQNLLMRIVSAQLPAGFSKRQFSCDSPNKNWHKINELTKGDSIYKEGVL